jgi:hypothetical protein
MYLLLFELEISQNKFCVSGTCKVEIGASLSFRC